MAIKEYSFSCESTRHCGSDVYAKRKPPVYFYTSSFFMGAGGLREPRI